ALTAAGARVVQAEAAVLAEATGITLEFHPLGMDAAVSVVAAAARGTGLRAVASAHRNDGTCQITVVAADGSPLNGLVEPIHAALAAAGIPLASMHPGAGGLGFVVGEANLTSALRAVHAVAVEGGRCTEAARRAS
ncbi:MAG: hypothetical protein SF070_18275, partial [Gemmatimonadota bacterium]|nr:hypothetical protein [Gemmatimonadota bacterium]